MIEIFNFKEVNSGMIAANFSIRLEKWGNFCIYNLVFFKNRDNNTKWIAVPCQKTQKEDRMKYFPCCGYEDLKMNEQFKKSILDALEDYILRTKGS